MRYQFNVSEVRNVDVTVIVEGKTPQEALANYQKGIGVEYADSGTITGSEIADLPTPDEIKPA